MRWVPHFVDCVTAASTLLLVGAGCPLSSVPPVGGSPGMSIGGSESGGDSAGTGGAVAECGPRNTTSLPPAGWVRGNVCVTLKVDPPDSPLAKVLLREGLCPDLAEICPGPLPGLIEIDALGNHLTNATLLDPGPSGELLYTRQSAVSGTRFVLTDGCLSTATRDMPDGAPLSGDLDFDPATIADTGCGEGRITVDRFGEVKDGRSAVGDTACVSVLVPDTCVSCGRQDDEWFVEISTTVVMEALGPLDGVSVSEWADACGGSESSVDIRQGDRFVFTVEQRFGFRRSPSPEELGYTVTGTGFVRR